MLTRRHVLGSTVAVVSSAASGPFASAQDAKFPARTLKIVVPFAAGGGVDVFARLLGEKISQSTGASVVVENRPGANGSIGGNAVRLSEADGYTVLFSASTHVMARSVMKAVPYDPLTDFAPIARVGEAPMLLISSLKSEAKTIAELIAAMKKEPGKWICGTAALGAAGHIATVAFLQAAAVEANVLAYRGTAPALNDVLGGHIQLMIDPVLALLANAQGKLVNGLAVTTAKRTRLAPDIPTLAESGLAGFDHSSWYGVWGPKNLPPLIASTLAGMFNAAVKQLDTDGHLAPLGIDPVSETADQFAAFASAYATRNAEVLKAAKFEPA